jgi:hypothetical protein
MLKLKSVLSVYFKVGQLRKKIRFSKLLRRGFCRYQREAGDGYIERIWWTW